MMESVLMDSGLEACLMHTHLIARFQAKTHEDSMARRRGLCNFKGSTYIR